MRSILIILCLALSSAAFAQEPATRTVFRERVQQSIRGKNNFDQMTPWNLGTRLLELSDIDSMVNARVNERLDSLMRQIPAVIYTIGPSRIALWNMAAKEALSEKMQWTTSGRPANPAPGIRGYNTTLNSLEYWNGSIWKQY